MNQAVLLIALIVIGAVAAFLIGKLGPRAAQYEAKRLLSAPEQVMFYRLKAALPEYEILTQVAFSRFIRTGGGTRRENFALRNSVLQKVADYVICRKDMSVLAVVELDDSTHLPQRDQKRDRILDQAGVAVIRWNVKALPNEQEIREKLVLAPQI